MWMVSKEKRFVSIFGSRGIGGGPVTPRIHIGDASHTSSPLSFSP